MHDTAEDLEDEIDGSAVDDDISDTTRKERRHFVLDPAEEGERAGGLMVLRLAGVVGCVSLLVLFLEGFLPLFVVVALFCLRGITGVSKAAETTSLIVTIILIPLVLHILLVLSSLLRIDESIIRVRDIRVYLLRVRIGRSIRMVFLRKLSKLLLYLLIVRVLGNLQHLPWILRLTETDRGKRGHAE